jgi:hydroxymethylpyrimidine pyrophosphatase-like HAD family hydrolase
VLPGYTVLRSSSPLGSGATWVEIFPSIVSKSQAAAWLAGRVGLTARDVLCVGNDYNDEDLLEWGGTSFVVANSPADLRARFTTVASSDQGGLAEAVARWLPGLA